jgi:hypothetical protein
MKTLLTSSLLCILSATAYAAPPVGAMMETGECMSVKDIKKAVMHGNGYIQPYSCTDNLKALKWNNELLAGNIYLEENYPPWFEFNQGRYLVSPPEVASVRGFKGFAILGFVAKPTGDGSQRKIGMVHPLKEEEKPPRLRGLPSVGFIAMNKDSYLYGGVYSTAACTPPSENYPRSVVGYHWSAGYGWSDNGRGDNFDFEEADQACFTAFGTGPVVPPTKSWRIN